MDHLLLLAHRLSRFGAWVAGALIIGAAVLIGVDIVMRKFFSTSVGGASELSGYVLAISASWGFALTLLDRAHIRIDSLYVVLPLRLRALMDILGLVVLLAFVGFLSWQCSLVFLQTYELGSRALTPIATPLVYPQALWLLGMVYFLIVIGLLLLRAVLALLGGDLQTVQRIAGSRSATQEVEEELRDTRLRMDTGGNEA
ncbi:MAG: TRAP transporter small permease [Gammaproteobacteria bacterium]|nr:TRAP transporter small permease [Gammaproteobacteria bacterium]